MTPAERQFFERAKRRTAGLQPEMRAVLLRAFEIVREQMTEAELARVIDSGQVEELFRRALTEAILDRAFAGVRYRIRNTVERGFRYATTDLPRGGKIDGVLAVTFDHLNPRVLDALRALETEAINSLKGDVKEAARLIVADGLAANRGVKRIGRDLRATVGLAPNQARYVLNLERELTEGRFADAAQRALLDRRFKLDRLADLPAAERARRITTIVDAYRRNFIAHNANVNAKQMVMDSYRAGQRMSWEDAKEQGAVPDGYDVFKTWVHFDPQPDPRPEHQALHGETVRLAQPYSTGQLSAGEGDWGCHCIDRYFVARV